MAAEMTAGDNVRPEGESSAAQASGANDANDRNVFDDTASSIDHVQEKAPPPLTKREKLKRHCVRWWWVHLIIFIVLLAILLPILFTVIIPKIVQSVVNSQKLPVYSGRLSVVSQDKVNITLETALDTPLKATIDPTELSLYNKDTPEFSPFFTVDLPKSTVYHKTNITVAEQTSEILNHTELVKFFNRIFDEKEVEVAVKAKPHVRLSSLGYDANLAKTTTVKSLDYLAGFGVKDMEFMMPPNDKGFNIKGHLNTNNAGALALYLGDLDFNVLAGDVRLALMHLYDVKLEKGMTHPYFEGTFFFDQLVPHLAEILSSQGKSLASGNLELTATGNATKVDGQNIKYVEEVLNKKEIHFEVPVLTLVGDLLNGLLGSDGGTGSLVDALGGVVGNSTLVDNVVGHWNRGGNGNGNGNSNSGGGNGNGNGNGNSNGGGDGSSNADNNDGGNGRSRKLRRSVLKRPSTKGAVVKSMLRLGLRTRTKAR